MKCELCPRNCKTDRKIQVGYCGVSDKITAARASLHLWEEPVISGTKGSGTVFFSGCSLGCVFCQNRKIALAKQGTEISVERLVEIFFELKEKGANNINLVTPTHFVPQICQALSRAKLQHFDLPIVYNTGSYEKVETLKMLEGLVDIYLPDCKYYDTALAQRYAKAPDYFPVAVNAIREMIRQVGYSTFYCEGNRQKKERYTGEEENILMEKGVIVRHLVLPGQIKDSKRVIKSLYDTFGDDIYLSIMNQYTPQKITGYPELSRKVTEEEYEEVVNYAIDLGVENGFIQEGDTASESFIPEFENQGIEKNKR